MDWPPDTYDRAAIQETLDGENESTGAAPSTACSKIDGFATLLEPLPRTLEKISAAIQHLGTVHMIQMAGGGDPNEPVSVVLRALLNAQQATAVAHGHLREAADLLSTMRGYLINDDAPEAADTAR